MRLLACSAIVLALGAASPCAAQNFTVSPELSQSVSRDALAPMSFTNRASPVGALVDRQSFTSQGEAIRWRSGQVQLAPNGRGGVSSLRVSVGSVRHGAAGLADYSNRTDLDDEAYEVALVRDWPAAVSVGAGKYNVDVSPHAGVGVGSAGGSAEAGAMVRVGRRDELVVERLKEMGVRDGAAFGDEGRWYLFAAASGRAVGMNMRHDESGWSRQGWSTDPSASTIADAQVGLAWRRGDLQTAFGYVRREVKTDNKVWGQETRADSLVALTFSIRPGD